MPEYIAKSVAIARLTILEIGNPRATIEDARRTIADTRTADVDTVVHGRWIHDGRRIERGIDWCHCSECGKSDNFCARTNYCPVCGAKMDGERKDGGADHEAD